MTAEIRSRKAKRAEGTGQAIGSVFTDNDERPAPFAHVDRRQFVRTKQTIHPAPRKRITAGTGIRF
jgi:hypothetical protein